MRWLQTEYLLKGIFLGLVLYAALQVATVPEEEQARVIDCLLRVNLATLAGLGAALLVAGLLKLREGYRAGGRLFAFVLFLLLESPTLSYVGILGGAVVGNYLALPEPSEAVRQALGRLFLPIIGGSAAAGLAFGVIRQLRDRLTRLALILALAAGLVAVGMLWMGLWPGRPAHPTTAPFRNLTGFAVQLLLGIPFFYLLTFAGQEEESEVEIGVMSGLLGFGLAILLGRDGAPNSLAFLVPVVVYFVYTIRVLPGLRVLKHAFRGLSYTRVGRHRRALQAFRRALQLDPSNRLARDGFWEVHRSLDLDQLANDPQTLALVDLDLCLDRAGSLLLSKPTAEQLDEAQKLLRLVLKIAPHRRPQVDYWHAVAHTHARQTDQAAECLTRVLEPEHYGGDNPQRLAVLLPAWQLALLWYPELRRRVGEPQLAHPGRRMEAIAAGERYLLANPDDRDVLPFKKLLYEGLTEAEYDAYAGAGIAAQPFDHAYCQHLGLSLINDDERWQRGGEYLRMAARGLPDFGPTIFVQIAQAQQRAGRLDDARHTYELAKRAGQTIGPKSLADAERSAYFGTVRLLGEDALARGDNDAAIENYRLYSESERSGIETLRTLAELYERRGDALAAARVTDQGLQYNAKDPDLLARKDRYYYSIMPDDLRRRLEHYGGGFDVAYCLNKAKSVLDGRHADVEWLEVAHHLTQLALVVTPDSRPARVLLARCLLRLGERDKALALLEAVRGPERPEKFASGDDEEAWYAASQLLGDLYLELDRADLAVPCLTDFRKSSKSGARTLFKLGQAYEMLGDPGRAVKCYQQVTAYETNPLAPEAHDAIARIKG